MIYARKCKDLHNYGKLSAKKVILVFQAYAYSILISWYAAYSVADGRMPVDVLGSFASLNYADYFLNGRKISAFKQRLNTFSLILITYSWNPKQVTFVQAATLWMIDVRPILDRPLQ